MFVLRNSLLLYYRQKTKSIRLTYFLHAFIVFIHHKSKLHRVFFKFSVMSISSANPLFLSDEELQKAIEMMFFAYRNFTYTADSILTEYGFGRAHHRAIYFIGRYPGITLSELLEVLQVSKQSLNRVLRVLVDDGFVVQEAGAEDKRTRALFLSDSGIKLDGKLIDAQKHFIERAYKEAGAEHVHGFLEVLARLVLSGAETRAEHSAISALSPDLDSRSDE